MKKRAKSCNFLLPKDNHDEKNDVEPELSKPQLLFKANTTEHFSDVDEMSSLIVSGTIVPSG